jgi:hypothetical protein
MGVMNWKCPTATEGTMNCATSSFSTEICAGATMSVVQYWRRYSAVRYIDKHTCFRRARSERTREMMEGSEERAHTDVPAPRARDYAHKRLPSQVCTLHLQSKACMCPA